jgi:hypothetical protein
MCAICFYRIVNNPGCFTFQFVHEHGEGRSALLKVIRKALPGILKDPNIDSDLLTIADMDRSKNDALDRLLRFPNDRKLTLLAPVLFPNGKQNMNEIFTGPIVLKVSYRNYFGVKAFSNWLVKVHRLMFFGPTSLEPGSKPALNSNGVKLDLKVTEESISAAGILVRLHQFLVYYA